MYCVVRNLWSDRNSLKFDKAKFVSAVTRKVSRKLIVKGASTFMRRFVILYHITTYLIFFRFESPEVQKRNVLNKITDRGKDMLSIIYPPFEDERIEQKFDDSERKKAEKYALSNDQILLTDALGLKVSDVKRTVVEKTPLAKVIEGRVITESTKDALEDVEGNSKLWIGKDYTNFIVKDFNNLDLPFVGKLLVYCAILDTAVNDSIVIL